jgi:hypothetical protein
MDQLGALQLSTIGSKYIFHVLGCYNHGSLPSSSILSTSLALYFRKKWRSFCFFLSSGNPSHLPAALASFSQEMSGQLGTDLELWDLNKNSACGRLTVGLQGWALNAEHARDGKTEHR